MAGDGRRRASNGAGANRLRPTDAHGRARLQGAQELQKILLVRLPQLVVTQAGAGQSPIYANLQKQSGELPSWNFAKYLVGKDGKVVKFYKSGVKPDDAGLRKDIEPALR